MSDATPGSPLFSVVIPCYNRADLVGATIESVLSQSFDAFEVICVNDGSPDNTLDVLRGFEPRVKVIDQANTGVAGARNTGARAAKGQYLIFLDCDDLLFPWTLDVFADAIRDHTTETHGGPALVAGLFHPFNEVSSLARYKRLTTESRYFDDYLRTKASDRPVLPSATVVRRDYYLATGGGEEVRFLFEDVEIWLKVGAMPGFVVIDAPGVAGYRVGHAQRMGDFKKQLEGFDWIAKKVRDGVLPGGRERRRDMEDILAVHAKGCAVRCVHAGDKPRGMAFYFRSLGWQIRNREWKFVAGYPYVWLTGKAPRSPSMVDKPAQIVSAGEPGMAGEG